VPHKASSCHLSKVQQSLKEHKIRTCHATFLNSTAKLILHFFGVGIEKSKLVLRSLLIELALAQFRPGCVLIDTFYVLIDNSCVSSFYYIVIYVAHFYRITQNRQHMGLKTAEGKKLTSTNVT